MDCYICKRDGYTNCSECHRTICKIHAEEVKGKTIEEQAICSSCKRKKRLRLQRIIAIISFFAMAAIIIILLIVNSLK